MIVGSLSLLITSTADGDGASSLWQTPSTITSSKVRNEKAHTNNEPVKAVPTALGNYQVRDVEEVERERGNAEFKGGNFTAAVKCYTKCLGLKARNYVAFSNRAMAYLKLKEYARAVVRFYINNMTCMAPAVSCQLL